jgi:TrmH family RNA methyltransferase
MAELIISSKDNRNVKLVRSLADKKGRRASGLFLTEGVANIREALASDLQAEMLLYADGCQSRPALADLLEQAEAKGAKLLALQSNLLAGLAQTEESQGLLLVLRQPACSTKAFAAAAAGRSVAVLDGLQDPGNVGTILRTAWAAGLGGVLLVNECADIFSPKVVRAAMGAVYHLPALALSNDEAWALLQQLNCQLVCADAAGRDFRLCQWDASVAWLLGREATGPSAFWRGRAEQLVAIPMQAGVDSLNVAVAAGILFFSSKNNATK